MKQTTQQILSSPHTKDVIDVAAGGAALGAYFTWLPNVAAGLAALWTLIRIYEWARVRIFGYAPPDKKVTE